MRATDPARPRWRRVTARPPAWTVRAGMLAAGVALGLGAAGAAPLRARTLTAGAGRAYPTPSAAIAAAQDGDTVRIAPGSYADCAIVRQNRLLIEGEGDGVVLMDRICGGKALLVIGGSDNTVRNLTLRGAQAPAGNGAGIRAEGGSLTVDGVRFIGNQDGILAADSPQATLRITGSTFLRNGSCANPNGCGHGVYVGVWRLLRIERTRFSGTREGHHVKSKARRTEITGSTIEDGPDGTSSYLVDLPVGGSLLIEGSALEKGPNCSNRGVAVLVGEDGPGNPTDEITLRDNHFTNDMPQPTVLVRNLTGTAAQLSANRLSGPVTPLAGPGSVRP